MINFRFHLVSLVAVFLALGLGILVGSTVIDQGIVNRLDSEIRSVRSENKARKAASKTLSQQNKQLQQYIDASAPFVGDGRLDGRSVAIVAENGVDSSVVKQTEAALRLAGADVPAVLHPRRPLAARQRLARAGLQSALNLQGARHRHARRRARPPRAAARPGARYEVDARVDVDLELDIDHAATTSSTKHRVRPLRPRRLPRSHPRSTRWPRSRRPASSTSATATHRRSTRSRLASPTCW